jgi:putative hydrolase of the HAD superfamily
MRTKSKITCAFLDIGGVLLTNGWSHDSRKRVVEAVGIKLDEFELRHHQTVDTFENGHITLSEYLKRTVFYTKRSFTEKHFRALMMSQSRSYPKMLSLFRHLKQTYHLKLVAVSNEGRELNAYRIKHFKLDRLFDTVVSSCFIHCRKPDLEIFRLALDLAQVEPANALYLDDISMHVAMASGLGMHGIQHTDFSSTVTQLAKLGLRNRVRGRHV